MIGRSGIGHRRLSPEQFQAVAAHLESMAETGGARNTARAEQRRVAAQAAGTLRERWTGPEAERTARALADWCFGCGERVETKVEAAYRALRELAVVARATAEVIARVEEHERGWLEQTGNNLGEWATRGGLNALDTVGEVTDGEAQARREEIDARNRLIEQASAERAAALDRWYRAMESTAHAVDSASADLKANTTDVTPDLRPQAPPAVATADHALALWTAAATRAMPGPAAGDRDSVRSWWEAATPQQRVTLIRTKPELVVAYLLDLVPEAMLVGDPAAGDVYRAVLDERRRDPGASTEELLSRSWIRLSPQQQDRLRRANPDFAVQAERPALTDVLRRYQVTEDPGGMVDFPDREPWKAAARGKKETVTAGEAELLYGLYWRARDMEELRNKAEGETRARYGTVPDGHQDAVQHAYWNALMTRRFGKDFARDYGVAHEREPGNLAHRKAMDLHNNEIGRRIATDHPDATPDQLLELADQALNNGELLVIDGSGHIQWSDRVGQGETGEADQAVQLPGHSPDDKVNLP